MVRINGEDKALAGINLLEYLKAAGYQLEKIVVERNHSARSVRKCGDSGK